MSWLPFKAVPDLKEFYLRLDCRGLAFFRIALGLLLIHSWFDRFVDREIFYSPDGMLPADVVALFDSHWKLSLSECCSTMGQVELISVLGLGCYVLFTLGFFTRHFHVLSLLFYVMQTRRFDLLLSGGQRSLAIFLFWALFLPLARYYSIDSLRTQAKHSASDKISAPCFAAFCIVLQIALIYLLSAYSKGSAVWLDGSAIYYVLQRDDIVKPLGIFFRDNLAFLEKPLTWGTLVVEWLAVPAILSPFFQPTARYLIIILLVMLHLGIWSTIDVCDFSFVMMSSFLLLIPSDAWDRLTDMLGRKRSMDAGSVAVKETSENEAKPPLNFVRKCASDIWAAILLGVVLVDFGYHFFPNNTTPPTFNTPRLIKTITYALCIGQNWRLFAPHPGVDDGWYVLVGYTKNGRIYDPLTGKAPTIEKPDVRKNEMYSSCSWRKLGRYLYRMEQEPIARSLCSFLIKRSRKLEPEDPLIGIKLYRINETTLPPGRSKQFPINVDLVVCEPSNMVQSYYAPIDTLLDGRP